MSESEENKFRCDVCKVVFPKSKNEETNKAQLEIHLKSKRHQRAALHDDKNERSVFVAGFHGLKTTGAQLRNHFKQFGPVQTVFMKRNYAIVEFVELTTRDVVLKETDHAFFRSKLRVEPRAAPNSSIRSKAGHPDAPSKKEQMALEVKELADIGELSDQVDHILEEHCLTEEDMTARENFRVYLENIFRQYVPEVGLRMYGSTVSGLGMKGCDLDLMVDINAYKDIPEDMRSEVKQFEKKSFTNLVFVNGIVTHESLVSAPTSNLVMYFLAVLRSIPDLPLSHFLPIPNARVPLLRVFHKEENIDCDLTFGSRLATQNTNLIKTLLAVDMRMQPLVLMIRYWARHVGLQGGNPAHSLSGYNITMMVYLYLQNTEPPILPSVEALAALAGTKNEVDGWDCTFCNDPILIKKRLMKKKNNHTVVELLQGFFEFYANLDWFRMVLCPRTGRCVDALQFNEESKISEKTASFRMNMLALQDPFDLSHNTMASLDISTTRHISKMLIHSVTEIHGHPKEWSITTILPDPPIYRKPIERHHDVKEMIFLFVPILLPNSISILENCVEAEKQWYDWHIEHLLRCLDLLLVDYEIIDNEDFNSDNLKNRTNGSSVGQAGTPSGKSKAHLVRKKPLRGSQTSPVSTPVASVQGPTVGPLRFSSEKIIKRQTTYQCIGFARMWVSRDSISKKVDEGPLAEADIFTKEAKVSEIMQENLKQKDIPIEPIMFFQMVVSWYSVGHETKIEVTLEDGFMKDFNVFVTFFPRYLRKMIRAAGL